MMSDRAPHISLVIPVYNEALIIGAAAEELRKGMEARGWDYEIVFAENGSRDSTLQILEGLSQRDSRIRWLHSDRPNYGSALKSGILEARGRFVLCDEIDLCDLSFHDAALSILETEGADMVIGSKAAKGASDHRPLVRRLATRMHNRLLRVTLGFRGTDTHGLKAFRRERLLPVVQKCVVDMDVFASEMVVRAWRDGLNVVEVPIQLREKRKPSVHLFKRVPNVLKNVGKLVYVLRIRGQ
jgi:glycosyltransferase involved in cell wall biosynthesis